VYRSVCEFINIDQITDDLIHKSNLDITNEFKAIDLNKISKNNFDMLYMVLMNKMDSEFIEELTNLFNLFLYNKDYVIDLNNLIANRFEGDVYKYYDLIIKTLAKHTNNLYDARIDGTMLKDIYVNLKNEFNNKSNNNLLRHHAVASVTNNIEILIEHIGLLT
jgi:hypothetical protein